MRRFLPSIISLILLLGVLVYKFINQNQPEISSPKSISEASTQAISTISATLNTASSTAILGVTAAVENSLPATQTNITPKEAANISFEELEDELNSILIEAEDFSDL